MFGLVAMTAVAYGEPVAIEGTAQPPREEPAPTEPLTSAGVRGAPLPGDESGRTDRVDSGDGVARRLGRAALWIPRFPLELVAQPVRGLLYVQDRYDAYEKLRQIFTTEDGRIAIFPAAFFETGFGLNAGARAYFKDLIDGERITLRAGIGGEYRWNAEVDVSRRFGVLTASLAARYEQRDREYFFGYGNGDLAVPAMPIDPLASDQAVSTRYRAQLARIRPRVRVQLPAHFAVTATAALVQRSFDSTMDADSITNAFAVDRLPGFADGTTYLHDELQLAWDTRRQLSAWDSYGVHTGGGLVLGFVDHQHGLSGEPDFVRAGVDLQRYLRLSEGPRVLALRFYGEVVTGARDEVPFAELPRLGGANLLRGYETGRFRDRVATVAQASYLWAAAAWLAPSLFVDVGRVHAGLDELSLDHPRVGFGGALEVYGRSGLSVRAELASSLDGGVFVFLGFQPAFDSRTERY